MKFILFAPVISLNLALSSLTNDTKISNLRVTLLKTKLVGQLHIYLNIVPVWPLYQRNHQQVKTLIFWENPINQSVTRNSIFVHFFILYFLSVPFQSLRDEGKPFSRTFIYHIYYIYTTYTTDGRREIASMSEVVDRVAVNN